MNEYLILNQRPYKDTDKLIVVFSPDSGKLILKAKGITKISSKRAGLLETGNIAKLKLYARSQIPLITEGEMRYRWPTIKQHLSSLNFFFFTLFLIDQLWPLNHHEGTETERVYDLIRDVLIKYDNELQSKSTELIADRNHSVHHIIIALQVYLLKQSGAVTIDKQKLKQKPHKIFDFLQEITQNVTGKKYKSI